jgi:hypothetical protein
LVEFGLDVFDDSGKPLAPQHLAEALVVEGAAEPDVGRDGVEDVAARNLLAFPKMARIVLATI